MDTQFCVIYKLIFNDVTYTTRTPHVMDIKSANYNGKRAISNIITTSFKWKAVMID